MNAWDVGMGGLDDMDVNAAHKSSFSVSVVNCYLAGFVFVSDDLNTFTVDPLICQLVRGLRFLLLT